MLRKPLQALLNIPSKIGVTATLNVQYKKPTKADQVSQSQYSKACLRLTDKALRSTVHCCADRARLGRWSQGQRQRQHRIPRWRDSRHSPVCPCSTFVNIFLELTRPCRALFVEPKYAQYLKNSGVSAALGERPRPRILDMDDTKEERVKHQQVKA